MGLKPLFLCCCFPSAEADGNRLLLLARFRSLFPQSVSTVYFHSLFPLTSVNGGAGRTPPGL